MSEREPTGRLSTNLPASDPVDAHIERALDETPAKHMPRSAYGLRAMLDSVGLKVVFR